MFQLVCLTVFLLLRSALAQVNHVETAARLMSEGQFAGAEREARQALKTPSTRALALAMLGTIRLQQGKFPESENLLNQALILNPNLVGARTTLGEALVFEGKSEDARKAFQEVLKRNPASFNARFDLAKLESSVHNFQKSLEVASPIISQLTHSEEGLLLLATDYGAMGKRTELEALPEKWQNLPAPSASASIDFADLLETHGAPEKAKDILADTETRLAAHPTAEVALQLSQAYLSLGELDRAERNSLLALSTNPDCTACDLTLAHIAERQGISEKALAYLVQAKKREPDNPEVLFEFGKVCLLRNLLEDALPALERAVDLQPDRDQYVYVLASANVGKGNLAKAATLIGGLLHKHPQDAMLNYAIGTVYYLQAKYPEAETAFKSSLVLQPDQVAAPYYLALTYDAVGDDNKAVEILRDVIRRHPDHAPSYVKLGSILARKQKYDEAEQDLQHAISLDPTSVEGHYQLGLVLGHLGKKAESENELAQWRQLQAEEQAKHEMHLRLLLPE
jgi:tetratricopeptide (TPR) repeat protein